VEGEPLVDLDAIERLAKRATPWPWEAIGYGVVMGDDQCTATVNGCLSLRGPTAEYIGALSPDKVLALVAALRSERARADGLQQAVTAAIEVRQKVESERDEARGERDALLSLRDSWANDYASLATFMRERDEARERAADYERACKAREEAIDGLTSEAMDLIKERDEARAALAEEQDSHKESLDIFRRRVDRLEAELAVVRCQRHRVLVYCLALKDAGHPDIAATLCKFLEDAP
jgi:hypothetical protein